MLSLIAQSITPKHNVIYRAELQHQRFIIRNSRSGLLWLLLALALLIPALLAALAFIVAAFLRPLDPDAVRESLRSMDWPTTGFLLLATMNVAMYLVVHLMTLGLAGQSIMRERLGKTWELLRMTDVGAASIVYGKWWATLRALVGDHALIAFLRWGAVAVLLTWYYDALRAVRPAFPIMPSYWGLPYEWVQLPLLMLIAAVYTALDAGLSAALGIFTALVSDGRPLGLLVGTVLRLVALGLALWWSVMTLGVVYGGGLLFIPLSIVGFLIYGLAIWGLLWAAERQVG